jgi:YVTN family beta-propeller protein
MRPRWILAGLVATVGLLTPVVAVAPDVARAASACNARAFVANSGDGNVSVIDVPTDTVVGSPFAVGGGPSGVATSPDGQKVYVTDDGGTTMKVLDAASGSVLATVDVGGAPVALAVSPDGHTAYVTNFFLGTTVTVVDLDTDTADGTITVGAGPSDVAFTPDGAHAYVTNFDGTTVSVIDTATRTVTPITVDANPISVAVSPDGSKVYVGHGAPGDTVTVIDTATDTVSGEITVGTNVGGIAFTPDGSIAFVAVFGADVVKVIDVATATVVGDPIAVGAGPSQVVVTSDGSRVYVSNSNSSPGTVSAIDVATRTVVGTITVGAGPEGIAVTDCTTPIGPVTPVGTAPDALVAAPRFTG